MGLAISRKKKKKNRRYDGMIREKVQTDIGFKMSVRSEESEAFIRSMMRSETAIAGATPTLYTNEALLTAINDYEEEQSLALCNQYIQRGGKIKHVRDFSNRTPLHYAVEKNYVHVAALFLEHDVDPDIEDNDGKTALDLALNRGADAMGALLVRKMDNESVQDLSDTLFHQILDVKFERTLLAFLDTFLEAEDEAGCHSVYVEPLETRSPGLTSKCLCTNLQNNETAFQILARKERQTVMCHPVLRTIISRKWNMWARNRFICYFGMYLFGLFCLTTSIVTSANKDDVMDYSTGNEFRLVFEVISVIYALLTFTTELRQIVQHRLQYLRQKENYLEFNASALVLVTVALRLDRSEAHWYTLAIGYVLWVMRFFKYTCVFSGIGTYVEAMKHILVYDFTEFASVFVIILMAFSGSYVIVARGDGTYMTSEDMPTFWAAMYVGFRTLIENQPVVEYADDAVYKPAAKAVLIVFMFVTMLVMLNILIAKLSNTYTEFQVDAKKGLIMRRAAVIARAERNNFADKCSCFKTLLSRFPCANSLFPTPIEDTITHVNLALLEPRLKSPVCPEDGGVGAPSLNNNAKKNVDFTLELQTIKTRLAKYMTDMNQRIQEVDSSVKRGERILLSLQDDMRKLVKKKAPKQDIIDDIDDIPRVRFNEDVKDKTATL